MMFITAIIEWLETITNSDFMPHGMCYLWQPATLWSNVLGDTITALSYFLIPGLLVYFIRLRKNIELKGVFLAFAIFIIACGLTHVLGVINVWVPLYNITGVLKLITALVSAATVTLLYIKLPEALKIPSPNELELVNKELRKEVEYNKQLRKELESQKAELEKTVETLEETQKLAKIGSWEVDVEQMTCEWSEEVYNIHEIPAGTPVTVDEGIKCYREDYQPVIEKAVNEAVEQQENWDEECVLVTRSGKETWVRILGAPVFEDGKLTKLRGLLMDIDEFKREEEERLKTELKFRSIFNNTFNFTGLLDPDGILIEANQSALDFGGFTLEEARGLHFADAPWWSLSKEINEKLRRSIKKAAEGEFIRYDVDVVGVGGQVITIDFSINPVFNAEGEVIYLVPEGRDITERIELVEQLELSEKQLRQFIEQAPIAVAMLDNDMKYITTSKKWFEEYEINEKSLKGKSHYDLFPEIRNMPEWMQIHQEVLNGVEKINPKDKFIRKDGSVQWISWKLIPWYNEPGEVGGMIMYTADITNEVEYREKLENLNELLEQQVEKRTQELNRVNKELESFSYSVSHDLRAPLRSINGFAKILEEDHNDSLNEEARRLIRIIRKSALRMGQLIDDILNFSRLGRKALNIGRIETGKLVREVIKETEEIYSDSTLEVEIRDLPDIKADLSLMKQVFSNLISNAVKYSSHRDKVLLRLASEIKDDVVILSISDNGVGFDMKYHDKLFGVFQRLHSADEFEGTGVGLAIVKRIINKHGGDIWAESEPGKGSTFYISLPQK